MVMNVCVSLGMHHLIMGWDHAAASIHACMMSALMTDYYRVYRQHGQGEIADGCC
jgi:hypothetical protein